MPAFEPHFAQPHRDTRYDTGCCVMKCSLGPTPQSLHHVRTETEAGRGPPVGVGEGLPMAVKSPEAGQDWAVLKITLIRRCGF